MKNKDLRIFKWLLLSLFVTLAMTPSLHAQTTVIQKEFYGEQADNIVSGARYVLEGNGTSFPSVVKFNENEGIPYYQFMPWLRENFNLPLGVDFTLLQSDELREGFSIDRYAQTYQGFPIDLGWMNVKIQDGNVTAFFGNVYDISASPSGTVLSEKAALQKATDFVGASSYAWESDFWENNIKEKTGDPDATHYPEGILMWANSNNGFRLAFSFEIHPADHHFRKRVIVDAVNGKVLHSYQMESNCVAASVNTIFNGNRTIRTQAIAGPTFRLLDDCTSSNMRIRDWNTMRPGFPPANPLDITSASNTWTTNNQRFGGSVLWATRESRDYFFNVFGRDSYDDAGGDIDGYINAWFTCNPAPCSTQNNASMTFTGGIMRVGLGNGGTLNNSYGTLDIIAHEYTHAVTGSTSALVYQDESGAINESLSDIFGDAVERRSTGTNDWLVGGDRANGGLRSLMNPKAANDPDTYLGTNWAPTGAGQPDNGGVHTNSGVMNFWFYLLSVGGTGTNDNGNDYTIAGIGFDDAAKVAHRSNESYFGNNTNYAQARALSVMMAEDSFGVCSFQAVQVENAWYAVGVGGAPKVPMGQSGVLSGTCSGANFVVDLDTTVTPVTGGMSYSWFAIYPPGISGGAGAGFTDKINETLTNSTGNTLTVIYTVTPSLGGCTGAPYVLAKPIHPTPTGANLTRSAICSDNPFSVNLQNRITNNVLSTFTWTVNYNGMTGGSGNCNSSCGNVISETLENIQTGTKNAVYTVTPTSMNGCVGSNFTVTQPYWPEPKGSNGTETGVCSGDQFSINLQSYIINTIAADFTWTANYNGLTGGAGAGATTQNLTETLTNPSLTQIIEAEYTITPRSEAHNCVGDDYVVKQPVYPRPPKLAPFQCPVNNLGCDEINIFYCQDVPPVPPSDWIKGPLAVNANYQDSPPMPSPNTLKWYADAARITGRDLLPCPFPTPMFPMSITTGCPRSTIGTAKDPLSGSGLRSGPLPKLDFQPQVSICEGAQYRSWCGMPVTCDMVAQTYLLL